MEINEIRLYNEATRRILKREAIERVKKSRPPEDVHLTLEEAKELFSSKSKEVVEDMSKGKYDEEIKKEMEIIRQEKQTQKPKTKAKPKQKPKTKPEQGEER